MKKSIFTLTVFLMTLFFCQAQEIEMTKVFGGYSYTQEGENLNMKGLVNALKVNPTASVLIKKARNKTNFSSVLGLFGGICIGLPVGQAIGGGESNWALAGLGAGLIVVGIPVASSANKQAKEAVEIYNSSLKANTWLYHAPQLELIGNGSGLGLSIRF